MPEFTYRCTSVITTDYGDSAGCSGKIVMAGLSVIPDGQHHRSRPESLSVAVPEGTRPGGLWRVVIEPKEQEQEDA